MLIGINLISIVAVHGIGANVDTTWTTKEVNWISDDKMLPQEQPTARIMTFSYDSQWLGSESIDQRCSLIADHLLAHLKTRRQIEVDIFH